MPVISGIFRIIFWAVICLRNLGLGFFRILTGTRSFWMGILGRRISLALKSASFRWTTLTTTKVAAARRSARESPR